MLGFMGTFGGDKLVDVLYTDGTTSAVTAGGTVYLYGGAELRSTDLLLRLSVIATVGYHVGRAGGSNGDYRFERIPSPRACTSQALLHWAGRAECRILRSWTNPTPSPSRSR